MEDEYPLCALCSRQIRKVNGAWQRLKYEVREGGQHFLGGRELRTKRKDPTRNFGCLTCYHSLEPTPVSNEFKCVGLCALCSVFYLIFLLSYHFSAKFCASLEFIFSCCYRFSPFRPRKNALYRLPRLLIVLLYSRNSRIQL